MMQLIDESMYATNGSMFFCILFSLRRQDVIVFFSNLSLWRAVVRELIETEEEFGKDLNHVVNKYINSIESARPPKVITDNKEIIFSNFKQIAEFHNT